MILKLRFTFYGYKFKRVSKKIKIYFRVLGLDSAQNGKKDVQKGRKLYQNEMICCFLNWIQTSPNVK